MESCVATLVTQLTDRISYNPYGTEIDLVVLRFKKLKKIKWVKSLV